MSYGVIVGRELDTDDLAEERRKAAYLSEIDHTLSTTFLGDPVFACLKSSYVGPMRIIELEASPRRSERTSASIARDRHDGLSVQLAVAGRADGEAAGRPVASAPGTIMILDFAQPFHMVDREPRTVINVAIPRDTLVPHVDDVRRLHGRVLDADTGGLLAAYLRALMPQLAHMPDHAAPLLCDIIVNLLLLALGVDPAQAAAPVSRRAALLNRTRQLIDARLSAPDLTPEWLIDRLNVSRSELYAALEETGGIARFIRQRRLEGARAALGNPHDLRRIGELAFAFGFSSEAHFARAFRAAFGTTAGEVRRAARAKGR